MSDTASERPPLSPASDPMAHERCDRCGVHARVMVTLPAVHTADGTRAPLPLTFCSHHFAEHEPALSILGVRLKVDTRADLVATGAGSHC